MLLFIAAVLLAAWLAGVLGVYSVGDAVHVLLLGGLMLLLLGLLKARDAATTAARNLDQPSKRT
jgi:ABC-type transport system involved in cytochrome c biogenesis permease subunit